MKHVLYWLFFLYRIYSWDLRKVSGWSKFVEMLSFSSCIQRFCYIYLLYSLTDKPTGPGSAVSEKVRTRLEELDDLEEVTDSCFKCKIL